MRREATKHVAAAFSLGIVLGMGASARSAPGSQASSAPATQPLVNGRCPIAWDEFVVSHDGVHVEAHYCQAPPVLPATQPLVNGGCRYGWIETSSEAAGADYCLRCDDARTTPELETCEGQHVEQADGERRRADEELREKHGGDERFAGRLKVAEDAWARFRDAEIDAQYPAYDQMSRYGHEVYLCMDGVKEEWTRARAAALRRRLSLSPESCAGPTPATLKAADDQLNRVYRQVREEMADWRQFCAVSTCIGEETNARDDAHRFREKLVVAERAWIAFRDAEIDAFAPPAFAPPDGTPTAPAPASACAAALERELTKERTTQLRQWLDDVSNPGCNPGSIPEKDDP